METLVSGNDSIGEDLLAEEVLGRAMDALREALPLEADRRALETLEPEARPAVESLEMALSLETADDIRSLGHHESLAMFSLLGRRAARLDVSVMVAHRLVPAILDAFETERTVAPGVREGLVLASLDGYVRGREERLRETLAEKAAKALPSARLADGVHLLVLAGDHEAEVLTERVEAFGRELHKGDARACVVELSGLQSPDARRAAAVLAADESARMLGVVCVFAGVGEAWRSAIAEAGVEHDEAVFHPKLQDALATALRAAGLSLSRPGPLGRLLRRRATDR